MPLSLNLVPSRGNGKSLFMENNQNSGHPLNRWIAFATSFLLLASCSSKPTPQSLMPTPVMYLNGEINPFSHLPASEKRNDIEVFYSTNREPDGQHYGNQVDSVLRFGTARVELGKDGETWETLEDASTQHPRKRPIPVRLVESREFGTTKNKKAIQQWAARIDLAVRKTATRDIVIYIHGAKVGFYHSCAFAAEIDHFGGRDFTAVAFDWPTHQEIFSYVDGVDVDHARRSSTRLAEIIRLLADRTSADRIHIVSWSAGARVHSRALAELGSSGIRSARSRYRLGVMAFAAGDVPASDFLDRLPAIHGLSERVLVYMSDADEALKWAARLMGGGRRLGFEPTKLSNEELTAFKTFPRLEAIDTSLGKKKRGFDITGHRYWFQHPWVNSDLILALRTGEKASKRGLSPASIKGIWYLPSEYPKEIGGIARQLTGGSW